MQGGEGWFSTLQIVLMDPSLRKNLFSSDLAPHLTKKLEESEQELHLLLARYANLCSSIALFPVFYPGAISAPIRGCPPASAPVSDPPTVSSICFPAVISSLSLEIFPAGTQA